MTYFLDNIFYNLLKHGKHEKKELPNINDSISSINHIHVILWQLVVFIPVICNSLSPH